MELLALLLGINTGLLAYLAWLYWTDPDRPKHKKD